MRGCLLSELSGTRDVHYVCQPKINPHYILFCSPFIQRLVPFVTSVILIVSLHESETTNVTNCIFFLFAEVQIVWVCVRERGRALSFV